MQWATVVGLEKMQQTDNTELQRTDREQRTEKPITEATLIADGSSG